MFKSKTVFVLGAGASSEIDLPLGFQLACLIRKKLDIRLENGRRIPGGDWDLYGRISREFPNDANDYRLAALGIRDGIVLANSIDDFLDRHSANERMVRYGKMAIVASVLEAERKSRLFVPRAERSQRSAVTQTNASWYPVFLKMLCVGVNKANIYSIFDNISFVDFNYDRCITQYIAEALQVAYQLEEEEAWNLVSLVKVLHPYGSLGELHYRREAPNIVAFGDPDERADPLSMSDRIKLYTEQATKEGTITEIKSAIAAAGTLVFLGFGFHDQNMKLITPPKEVKRKAQAVFATAYKMSDADCEVIRRELLSVSGSPVRTLGGAPMDHIYVRNDLTCSQLLLDYSKSLVASR